MLPFQRSTGIRVKYLAWTDHRPSRVKLINTLSGKSKTFTYDHHFDHDYEQAYSYLTEGGCKVTAYIYDQKSGDATLIMDRVENQSALIKLGLA